MRYSSIGDYALIGDCHGSALVSSQGAIDWACLARFDAGSVFSRILDSDRGGTFAFTARDRTVVQRRYLPRTNVLETTFSTQAGRARIIDCFTMHEGGRRLPYRQLLRVVEGVEGTVTFDVLIMPRFDYASLRPWLSQLVDENLFTAVGGDDAFVLQADAALEIDREDVCFRGTLSVKAEQRSRFSIVSCPPHEMAVHRLSTQELDRRLDHTIDWWHRWVARGRYGEEHVEPVMRSALVLKLLTCAPTGGIVAAPTTSLPERVGGERNWDYRFSWVRDASHTLAALLAVGHPEVATGFKLFIERAAAGRAEDLQVVYGCYGERRIPEQDLSYLEGYRGSRPVRVGNSAAFQTQLDIYGELMEAAHLWIRAGNTVTEDGWRFLQSVVEAACAKWREADRGMWEVRSEPRHFVESKVMCWVAVARGIETAVETGRTCDLARWERERDELRRVIEREGVDPERGCFVQSFGSREVDAGLLLLPMVGFVDAKDPRMQATVRAIEEDLGEDGLVRRYRGANADDGLSGDEGFFLMTSFWLVDVLIMQGQHERARQRFTQLLALANDVGLFSEEYDPVRRELLGNFPQAFTHMALINSATLLEHSRHGRDCTRSLADRVPSDHQVRRPTAHHGCADEGKG